LQKNLNEKLAKMDSSVGMIADEQREGEEVKNFEVDFQTSEQQVAVRKVIKLVQYILFKLLMLRKLKICL
jgi:hypothetical protein